jgi:general secretion pathway protein A
LSREIVEEVQYFLNYEILKEVKLISKRIRQYKKPVTIYLLGTNELDENLKKKEFTILNSKITSRYNLQPLTKSETGDYVKHSLKAAGAERKIFENRALREIYYASKGYPRLINFISDRALLVGYNKGMRTITAKVVRECAQELALTEQTESDKVEQKVEQYERGTVKGAFPWGKRLAYLTLMVLILLGGLFFASTPLQDYFARMKTDHDQPVKPSLVPLAEPDSLQAALLDSDDSRKAETVTPEPDQSQGVQPVESSRVPRREPDSLQAALPASDDGRRTGVVTQKVEQSEQAQPVEPSPVPLPEADSLQTAALEPVEKHKTETVVQEPDESQIAKLIPDAADSTGTSVESQASSVSPEGEKSSLDLDFKRIIPFNYKSNRVSEEGQEILAKVVALMRQNQEMALVIRGHTDNVGSAAYNRKLSESRANIVKDHLVVQGIASARIRVIGMGESDPLMSNTTPEGRAENRRVDIEFTQAGKKRPTTTTLETAQHPAGKTDSKRIIPFNYKSNRVSTEGQEILAKVVALMRQNQEMALVIRGHTDNVGSAGYNWKLSKARANIVKDYLIVQGIGSARIRAIGMGESDPLMPNTTPEGQAANRRVEIELVNRDGNLN